MNNDTFARPEPKFLTTAGVIDYLKTYAGFAPSRSNLYKLTMQNQIPHIKGPGNRVLFPITEIRQWVENGGRMANAETEGGK